MSLALTLGARGQGQVWPNPAVGCVIVREGRVIARGWTQRGGRPHAEAMALGQCDARGASAYVTLEPCSHTGQTPPCAQALVEAGIARVVIAVSDPDPRVSGKGIAMLEAAGIEVQTGILEPEASQAHQGFFSRITKGRPNVTLKLASSIDGRIATHAGDSQWITGPLARRAVHAMRARHDAVWVGAGTARADDPSLTVRGMGRWNDPVRIVSSAALDVPQDGQLAQTARDIALWLFHGPKAPAKVREFWLGQGARLFEVPQGDAGLDIEASVREMAKQGLTRVFCEGGGKLAGGLLRSGCVDRLIQFTGGAAIGADGLPSLGALGTEQLEDAPRFRLTETRKIGLDSLNIWTAQTP